MCSESWARQTQQSRKPLQVKPQAISSNLKILLGHKHVAVTSICRTLHPGHRFQSMKPIAKANKTSVMIQNLNVCITVVVSVPKEAGCQKNSQDGKFDSYRVVHFMALCLTKLGLEHNYTYFFYYIEISVLLNWQFFLIHAKQILNYFHYQYQFYLFYRIIISH